MTVPSESAMPIVAPRPSRVLVDPGGAATIEVTVTNAGGVVDEFAIELLGVPGAWGTADPPRLSLFPGQVGTASVRVAPPVGPAAPAGSHDLGIRVRSTRDPAASAVEEVRVEVSPQVAVTARIVPSARSGSGSARYRLDLENTGNAAVDVALGGRDPDELVKVVPDPPSVQLSPGARAKAKVKVTAVEPFFRGSVVQRPFFVDVSTDRVLATAGGRLDQGPLLGGFVVPALAALIALGAIAFALNNGIIKLPGGAVTPTQPPVTAPATVPPTAPGPPDPSGAVPPSVAPPTSAAVFAEGRWTLGPADGTDLDDPARNVVKRTGTDADELLDLLAGRAAPLGIEPLNRAEVILAGSEAVGRDECARLLRPRADYAIGAGALSVGRHLCVSTTEGRISELVVVASGALLVLDVVTWEAP